MIIVNIKNTGGSVPKQATENSAGYDIIAISDPKIIGEKLEDKFFLSNEPKVDWWKHIFYIEYETGLYIAPLDNVHTLIYPRSSISSKTNLILANSIGLIDTDYRGQILCRFRYIWQPFDLAWLSIKDHSNPNNPYVPMTLGNINPNKIYKKGDIIAQLVFNPTTNVKFIPVNELNETMRAEGGFGSTDKSKNTPPTMGTNIKERAPGEEAPKIKRLTEFEAPPAPPKSQTDTGKGSPIIDAYKKAGGIPIKKRYTEEMKERSKQ